MKAVHVNKEKALTADGFAACLLKAKAAEANDAIAEAIANYKCCIKLRPAYEPAYNRLMILYRKNKEPKKELDIINNGIKAFEAIYNNASKKTLTKTAVQLSKSLSKSTGLTDKKGKDLFEQPPIPRWRQRAALVQKRLT